jgi:hypothetical protein
VKSFTSIHGARQWRMLMSYSIRGPFCVLVQGECVVLDAYPKTRVPDLEDVLRNTRRPFKRLKKTTPGPIA